MPRKRRVKPREIPKDYIYNSELVQKFINIVMRKGKKSLAERIVYKAFDIIKDKLKKEPMEVFFKALDNVRPRLKTKPRRIGGATYQIPVDVPKDKGLSIGMRWLVSFAKQAKGKPMHDKLANELINAYNNTGLTIKKKEDTHKMAIANRAFVHYRF
jgi:small subunit ribosomal protein S7